MSTTTTNITRPSWSDPALDREDVDERTHHDDRGVWIRSRPVDEWVVVEEQDGRTFIGSEPAVVYVDGFRHYNRPDLDWPDNVRVVGSLDASGGDMMLPTTARRLAAALVSAAELVDRD